MTSQKTILIVEDNPANLKLLTDLLTFQGYCLLEATNGNSALNLIKEKYAVIDLVLMDLKLPDISGLDVINSIKEIEFAKNIPVIVVSAHAMESDIEKCRQAGCIDYITKPINLQEFIKKISAFFAQK